MENHLLPAIGRLHHSGMRIIAWNCCKGGYSEKLPQLLALKPDIAIIQETPKPKSDGSLAENQGWLGENPHQGLLVQAFKGWKIRPPRALDGLPQFFLPLHLSRGSQNFNMVAVWVKKGKTPQPYLTPIRKALTRLSRFTKSAPTVLAGDFNVPCAGEILQRFNSISAYHTFYQEGFFYEHDATHYFYKQRHRGFHYDYCFIPEEWRSFLKRVEVGSYRQWVKLSDHCPLVVDLTLPGRVNGH